MQDKDPVKVETIPYEELKSTFDETHIRLNEWKAKLLRQVRPTTFSNDTRFKDYHLNYTQECADRSLIDCQHLFKLKTSIPTLSN